MTNRLSGNAGTAFTSKIRARDWARMAREKNLFAHAEAWEKADREGWDDEHYQPEVAQIVDWKSRAAGPDA